MSWTFDQGDEVSALKSEIAELKAVLQSARIAANRDLEAKRVAEIDRDLVIHERDATLEAVRMVADGVYAALIRGPVAEPLSRLAPNLERRVRTWVETRIGPQYVTPKERAMRLFEESCELLQAEGISFEKAIAQVDYVFSRPIGEPLQEAGGVAVCLLGWCAANDTTFRDVAMTEIERIEAKPLDQIRGSLARKHDVGLVHGEAEGAIG